MFVLTEIHARGYTNTIPTPAECVDADDKRLLRLWIEKLGLDELGVQETLNYALSCQPLGHVRCIEMLVKEFRANPGKLVDDLLTYDLTEELEELFDMLDMTFPPELIVEQFKRYYPTSRWICWETLYALLNFHDHDREAAGWIFGALIACNDTERMWEMIDRRLVTIDNCMYYINESVNPELHEMHLDLLGVTKGDTKEDYPLKSIASRCTETFCYFHTQI